jgi:hypothetical protein
LGFDENRTGFGRLPHWFPTKTAPVIVTNRTGFRLRMDRSWSAHMPIMVGAYTKNRSVDALSLLRRPFVQARGRALVRDRRVGPAFFSAQAWADRWRA